MSVNGLMKGAGNVAGCVVDLAAKSLAATSAVVGLEFAEEALKSFGVELNAINLEVLGTNIVQYVQETVGDNAGVDAVGALAAYYVAKMAWNAGPSIRQGCCNLLGRLTYNAKVAKAH